MNEFNLSDKEHYFWSDTWYCGADVREFIKRLKEDYETLYLHIAHSTIECETCNLKLNDFRNKIDKLAGEKLTTPHPFATKLIVPHEDSLNVRSREGVNISEGGLKPSQRYSPPIPKTSKSNKNLGDATEGVNSPQDVKIGTTKMGLPVGSSKEPQGSKDVCECGHEKEIKLRGEIIEGLERTIRRMKQELRGFKPKEVGDDE